LSNEEISQHLQKLDFTVEPDGEFLRVTAPDYRLDIEGQHDVLEEICRMYGYDNIPSTEIADVLPPQRNNVELDKETAIQDALVALGLQEIITYRLTTPEREAKLLAHSQPDDRPYLRLQNVISQDRVALRHSLLASVAEVAAENSKHAEHIALFELGKIYLMGEEGGLPDELRRVALVMAGRRTPPHWQDGLGEAPALDFFDMKGVVEGLLGMLGVSGVSFVAGEHPSFRPGRTAVLQIGKRVLGWVGELHPLVVEALAVRLDTAVLAAELDVELLLQRMGKGQRFQPISIYPAILEDIALVVDKNVPAQEVQAVIEQSGGGLLQKVELFDVYEGGSIPAGQRSLAYHLTFQATDKVLKDKDVQKVRGRIISTLGTKLGAKLRA
jgi:phenylalanyl-tRNA synthetase beta chain